MHIIAADEKSTVAEGKTGSVYKKLNRATVPHHRVKGESIVMT